MVDYAIAPATLAQDWTYLVALYAPPDEYETLHREVFVPVVEALAPLQ